MKIASIPVFGLLRAAVALWGAALPAAAATAVVNTLEMSNDADAFLSLPEGLAVLEGTLDRALTAEEAAQITGDLGPEDRVHFNIQGAGPHLLMIPEGGLRVRRAGLTIDGYTQPGAMLCTNPADQPNNAVIQIVLDARNGNHTGQPDEPEGRILVINAPDVTLRGLAILSTFATAEGGDNYGVGWGEGGAGGRISGCWIGLHPDGVTVAGGEVGVSAFETGGTHLIGTDADGLDDDAERNVIVGHNVQIMFEDARECRVGGNFLGVMPDGRSLIPEAAEALVTEGDAIEGGSLDGLVIGSPAAGPVLPAASNVIGGMKDEVIQFYYGANTGVVIRGNRAGLAIDDQTPLPNGRFYNPSAAEALIADNILANHVQPLITLRGKVMHQRNRMSENAALFDRVDESFMALQSGDADPVPRIDPLLTSKTRLVATLPEVIGEGFSPAVVDLYWCDTTTAATVPQGRYHLAAFTDSGAGDADPVAGRVDLDLSGIDLPPLGPGVLLMTATVQTTEGHGGTTPFSEPAPFDLRLPTLDIFPAAGNQVHLEWTAPKWVLEQTATLSDGSWQKVNAPSPLTVPTSPGIGFFRLRLP